MARRIVIVGAGILGASLAYQLSKSDDDIVVVDAGIPGDGATAASFAWLNSNAKERRDYHDMNVMSMAEHRAVALELGARHWLRECGSLRAVDTAEAAEELAARVDRLQAYGYPARLVEERDLRLIDPRVRYRESYAAVAYFSSEGFIDTAEAIRLLLAAAVSRGVSVRPFAPVAHLETSGSSVSGVRLADGSSLAADLVVLATGVGITALLRDVGVDFPTEGVPGFVMETWPGVAELRTILHLPLLSVKTSAQGRLVFRARDVDREIARETLEVPVAAQERLAERVAAAIKGVDSRMLRVQRVKSAVRPHPVDGMPLVGEIEGVPGVYVMSMHSGVTLGALIARLAAEELGGMDRSALLGAFRPSRSIASTSFDVHRLEGEA